SPPKRRPGDERRAAAPPTIRAVTVRHVEGLSGCRVTHRSAQTAAVNNVGRHGTEHPRMPSLHQLLSAFSWLRFQRRGAKTQRERADKWGQTLERWTSGVTSLPRPARLRSERRAPALRVTAHRYRPELEIRAPAGSGRSGGERFL